MEIKRKNKHIKDCGAVRHVKDGVWKSAWAYPKLVWANKYGNETPKRSGYVPWLKIICNDISCHAELWVRNDNFLEDLPSE